MQFQQNQLTRSTKLTLRADGLHVSQRDARGAVDIAVEIPYEEVLPVRLEQRNLVPRAALPVGGFALVSWVSHLVQPWVALGRLPVASDVLSASWLLGAGSGLALLLVGVYAWRHWWHHTVLHTAHLRLVLADHPRDRQLLRAFVHDLQAHTKSYLRREYAPINPLGLIEPQLRRLAWLHELDVLSTPEAQALATRLTGRLPGRPLRSMGQKLEAPYVN